MSSSDESISPSYIPQASSSKRSIQGRVISPPPLKRRRQETTSSATSPVPAAPSSISISAAIEAGKVQITDHLSHFTHLLSASILSPYPFHNPQLPISSYASLYQQCHLSPQGAHFVIHQHDHPIAGTHYDLRLQINGTSSASWAIMKGPPGNPNSKRLGRNATETRVHCLWNHLVESGSWKTGSLVVWDTGRYEVLPGKEEEKEMKKPRKGMETDEEDGSQSQSQSQIGDGDRKGSALTEQEKFAKAFKERRIKLRLHGAKLPRGYTVILRLSLEDDVEGQVRARREVEGWRRRRSARDLVARKIRHEGVQTDSESEEYGDGAASAGTPQADPDEEGLSAMERELQELEDEQVRRTNAYPGAENTIGSVHQRRWFLTLDRPGSGFVKRKMHGKNTCVMDETTETLKDEGEENRLTWPFVIRGSEFERSVVTGRLGNDVLRDEGVTDFKGRKGWRAITD